MAIKEDKNTAKPTSIVQAPPLKAPTDTRLRPENDPKFQKTMNGIVAGAAVNASVKNSDDEHNELFRFRNIIEGILRTRDELTNEDLTQDYTTQDIDKTPIEEWVAIHKDELGEDFNPKDPIDMSYAEVLRQTPDREYRLGQYERMSDGDNSSPRTQQRIYKNVGEIKSTPEQKSSVENHTERHSAQKQNDYKPQAQKLDPVKARTELAADIATVSKMYAVEAGLSEKDLAKVLGGIATIESKFGTLRSTKLSSAGGAFHYINSTIKGEVIQSMNDPRIANRVNEHDMNITSRTKQKSISDKDAWELKEDNILVGSLVAKNVIKAIKSHPELKNDVNALTTYVYQSHNLGEGGAKALARGGRAELERVSSKADDNNPMFFRGAKSDEEINARYNKFVSNAIASASPLIDTALAGEPKIIVAAVNKSKDAAPAAPAPV